MLIHPLGAEARALMAAAEAYDLAAESAQGVVTPEVEEAEEAYRAALDSLVERLHDRADDIGATLTELRLLAARTREATRLLQLRAHRRDVMAERLFSTVQDAMEKAGLSRVTGLRHTLTIQANGGAQKLEVNEAAVPAAYRKPGEPDNAAIRRAIEAGEALPFARLAPRGRSLRVRT